MKFKNIKTQLIDWNSVEPMETRGVPGVNTAKQFVAGSFRIRLAEYSANYMTAEWCDDGHIIHCIEGEITLHFRNENNIKLNAGSSVIINEGDSHKASTENLSARLFVID
jgi:quercetin dioxygenase-like cupin family protein